MIASGVSALLIALVAVAVWYGSRRPEVTITTLDVSGGSTVSHDVVRDRVQGTLSGNYVLLLPRRFSFLYPKDAIVDAVNSVPRVYGAEVARSSLTELSVTFREYEPFALWCAEAATGTTVGDDCLFVDSNGYAYADAPSLSGETLIRFVVQGRAPERGKNVYASATLEEYRALITAIEVRHGHRVHAMTETKDGDLVIHLNQGVNLLITRSADIEEAFGNLESILAAPEFEDVPLEEFEYIDLRFGNKVYVKRRGADAPSLDAMPPTVEDVQ